MHPPRVLTPRSNSSNMRLADFAPSTTTESASFSSAASSIYTQSFIKLAEERKIKARMQQEAVIGGITKPGGGKNYFETLMLGVYVKTRRQTVRHAGTRFPR